MNTLTKDPSSPLSTTDVVTRRKVPRLAKILVAAVTISAAVFAIRSLRSGPNAGATAAPARDAPFLDGELVRYSDDFARRNDITTVPVTAQKLAPTVEVTGSVTFDGRAFAAVGARIDGRVRRVFKFTGDMVKPNEAVAEIESAELGRAEALVLGARAKEIAAEADMKRERRLADAHVSAERDAEFARAHFEAVRADRVASERMVQALGGDLQGELGILMLRSPLAGTVISGKVSRGQTVSATTTAFEIADLGRVWVELRVFERDVSVIRPGDRVDVTTNASLQPIAGRVDHVSAVLDREERTALVRVVVDNEQRLLRPGQSAHARIHTASSSGVALTVPRVAVTRIDGKPTVLVAIGTGAVVPRVIQIGAQDARFVTVNDGLKEGEKVVVGGLFALKSELFR